MPSGGEFGAMLLGLFAVAYGAYLLSDPFSQRIHEPRDSADSAPSWHLPAAIAIGTVWVLTGALLIVFAGGWIGAGVVLVVAVGIGVWFANRLTRVRRRTIDLPDSAGELRIRSSWPLSRWKPWGPTGQIWSPPSHEVTLRVGDPLWDFRRLADIGRDAVQGLDVSGMPIHDEDLGSIISLQSLRFLDVSHTSLSDVGVRELAALSGLEYINLRGLAVTRESFDALAALEGLWQVDVDPAVFDASEPLRLRHVAVSVSSAEQPSLWPRPESKATRPVLLRFNRGLVSIVIGQTHVSDETLAAAGDAIGYAEYILRDDSSYSPALHSKAVALVLLNRVDAAADAAYQAAQADPSDPENLHLLTYAELARNNSSEARRIADMAVRRSGGSPGSQLAAADAHRNRVTSTLTERSYRAIAAVLRTDSNNPGIRDTMEAESYMVTLRPIPDVGSAATLAEVLPLAPPDLHSALEQRIRRLSGRNWVTPAALAVAMTLFASWLRSTDAIDTMEPWWWLLGTVPAGAVVTAFIVQWWRLPDTHRRAAVRDGTPTIIRTFATALVFASPFLAANLMNLSRPETNFTPDGVGEWLLLVAQAAIVGASCVAIASTLYASSRRSQYTPEAPG